jgi:hypothetical protein
VRATERQRRCGSIKRIEGARRVQVADHGHATFVMLPAEARLPPYVADFHDDPFVAAQIEALACRRSGAVGMGRQENATAAARRRRQACRLRAEVQGEAEPGTPFSHGSWISACGIGTSCMPSSVVKACVRNGAADYPFPVGSRAQS